MVEQRKIVLNMSQLKNSRGYIWCVKSETLNQRRSRSTPYFRFDIHNSYTSSISTARSPTVSIGNYFSISSDDTQQIAVPTETTEITSPSTTETSIQSSTVSKTNQFSTSSDYMQQFTELSKTTFTTPLSTCEPSIRSLVESTTNPFSASSGYTIQVVLPTTTSWTTLPSTTELTATQIKASSTTDPLMSSNIVATSVTTNLYPSGKKIKS